MKLEDGYVRLNKNYSMLTDQYELNMANSYFESGMKDTVGVFDVFFRKVPSNGGYALMAGVDKVIEYINNLKFSDNDLAYFKSLDDGEFVKVIKCSFEDLDKLIDLNYIKDANSLLAISLEKERRNGLCLIKK